MRPPPVYTFLCHTYRSPCAATIEEALAGIAPQFHYHCTMCHLIARSIEAPSVISAVILKQGQRAVEGRGQLPSHKLKGGVPAPLAASRCALATSARAVGWAGLDGAWGKQQQCIYWQGGRAFFARTSSRRLGQRRNGTGEALRRHSAFPTLLPPRSRCTQHNTPLFCCYSAV